MGPLDVRDYGIHSSHFSRGREVLAREGALEGERVQVRRGHQDEGPASRLRGGDLAPRFYYLDVLGIDVCFVCFLL
jgi:hypothetical protein